MSLGNAFVGRALERAQLRAAIDAARDGRPTTWLVSGEAGIGKTRLVRDVTEAAEREGVRTAWGSAWEGAGAPNHWPWRQIVAAVLDAIATPLPADIAQHLGDLLPSDPAGALAVEKVAGNASDVEDARFRKHDGLVRLIRLAAQSRPLAVVLDDVHVADLPSLQALAFIARHLRSARAVIFATVRTPMAPDARPELASLLAKITRDAASLVLAPLPPTEAQQLLGSFVAHVPSDVEGAVLRATHGNPLYIGEVGRLLAANPPGALRERELPIPPSAREAVRERIASLASSTMAVLADIAIVGEPLAIDRLLQLVPDRESRGRASTLGAIHEALAHGILVERSPGHVAFFHPLVREVLYRNIAPDERARLHERVAHALEAAAPNVAPGELAHHWLSAGSAGARRGIVCAIRAIEHHLRAGAHEEASQLLDRATTALGLLAHDDVTLRAELLLARGVAEMQAGQPRRAQSVATSAIELAAAAASPVLHARAVLVYANELDAGSVDPRLVDKLESALALLDDADPKLRARLEARLAAARQPAADPEAPMQLARSAIAKARALDEATELDAVYYGTSALMDFAHPTERIPLNERTVQLATRLGDRPKALRAHARLVFDAMELGDVTMADSHVEAYLESVRALQSPRHAWPGAMLRALRALFDGRFGEARACVEEAATLGRAADDRRVNSAIAMHRFVEARTLERHDDMIALANRLAPQLAAGAGAGDLLAQILVAGVHARAEREHDAREAWSKVETIPLPALVDRSCLTAAVEAAAFVRDEARCRELLPHVVRYEALFVSWGMLAFACEGPVARLLGLLHDALGDHVRADAAFHRALGAAQHVGAKPHAVRIQYESARAKLSQAPRGAARDDLLLSFDAVAREADSLGMAGLSDLVARRTGTLRPSAPPPAGNLAPAPTTTKHDDGLAIVREGDVYALHWKGITVRVKDSRGSRILEQLVLKPGIDIHVLDLVEGSGADREQPVIDLGDAGEVLDGRAIDEYRAELLRLEDAAERADELGNAAAAADARAKALFLARELAGAVGLGGRAKRRGQNAERARVAVQRRVRDLVQRVRAQSRELGAHLEHCVKTGMFCVYTPEA